MRAWVHRAECGCRRDAEGGGPEPEESLDYGHRDPVTGLHSRLWAEHAVADLFLDAHQAGRPITIVLFAIDDLHVIEERHGALLRDAALLTLAGALAGVVRSTDAVVRWGPDTILLALFDADATGASLVIDRARARTSHVAIPAPDGELVHLGLSCGWATAQPGPAPDGLTLLLHGAESALCSARRLVAGPAVRASGAEPGGSDGLAGALPAT